MLHMPSREVLICLCVDAAVILPAPSFNCQCELCGARIWVPHNSPSNPRACVGLAALLRGPRQLRRFVSRGNRPAPFFLYGL